MFQGQLQSLTGVGEGGCAARARLPPLGTAAWRGLLKVLRHKPPPALHPGQCGHRHPGRHVQRARAHRAVGAEQEVS